MKIRPCVNFWFGVSLFCFFVMVSGSGSGSIESESESDQSKISKVDPSSFASEISQVLSKYFKALEERNRELEKSHEELKEQFKASQEKCNEQFNSLSKKLEDFKNEVSEDHGISLLTPPLRGPPGKQGEKGDQGKDGKNGEPGPKGEPWQLLPTVTAPISVQPRPKGDQTPRLLKSCSDAMEILPSPRSKKQKIYPHGNGTSLEVFCDFESDGGGWTLIQKRSRGPGEEFKQNWNEYAKGFGSLDGNFWLGLDNIHALTQNGDQELRIELEDFEGQKKYAKYSNFSVSDASDEYRLSISGFSGDSTLQDSMAKYNDGLLANNGTRFSAKDKDNDSLGENCAVVHRGGGGWWHTNCGASGLNGLYFEKGEAAGRNGIWWYSWKGEGHSLAKSEMKVRTRKSM